jgi:hypothetical protein
MRFPQVHGLMLMAVLVVSSKGLAAAPTLECEGTGDQMICMSLPAEAPESAVAQQAPVQEAMPSLIAGEDRSGAAADFTVLADAGLPGSNSDADIATIRSEKATSTGMQVLAQTRKVETFLRSGPASTGEGIVAVSSHP